MVSPLLSWWTVTNVAGRKESSSSLENMGSTVTNPHVRRNAISITCKSYTHGVNGFHLGNVCTVGVLGILQGYLNHAIALRNPKEGNKRNFSGKVSSVNDAHVKDLASRPDVSEHRAGHTCVPLQRRCQRLHTEITCGISRIEARPRMSQMRSSSRS